MPVYGDLWNIGVLYGPHGAPDFFTKESIDTFFAAEWQVHYNSNRLGVRLVGPKPQWARQDGGEAGLHPSNVHDCEYAIGAINFTGDFPVILTRDGPSLGGFVCPVTIAKAELWKVGQVKPGDKIRFHPISFEQAQALELAQQGTVDSLMPVNAMALPVPSLLPDATVSATILAALPATAQRPSVEYRQAGDGYVLIEYGDNVLDLAVRMRIYLLMNAIRAAGQEGIEELSPGVRSLQIRYDSRVLHQGALLEHLLTLEHSLADVSQLKIPTRIVHMPMAFEDSATLGAVERYQQTVRADAPWLPNNVDFIQRTNGLASREEVKNIIFDASYLILGLGDVYLGAPCAVPVDPRHRLLSSKYNPARTYTAEGTVGIGFVLIYKASGVFNFAQGSMLLFAALTFVSLHDQGVPFAWVLLLTVIVMIVGALLIERLVLRPLVNRSQITLFMATLGLSFIIEGLAQGLMGSQVRALDLGIDDVPLFVGPLMLSQFDLIAAAAAVVLVTVLALLFNKTRIGVSLRAVADDTTAALSIGINLNRIWQIVWAVAGVVGLVAGLLWGARRCGWA